MRSRKPWLSESPVQADVCQREQTTGRTSGIAKDESQPEVLGHLNRGQVGQRRQLGSLEEKSLYYT